jgi:ribosomal protein RSM22 (predicted rRNA methylase)
MNQQPASSAWAALPAEYSAAISNLLEGRTRKDLVQRAARLSEGFRARRSSKDLLREEEDALAYALTRLPATFAANSAVLRRVLDEAPEFSPKSLLDAGCGLASASLAALEAWPDIETITLLDRSAEFLALVERLIASSRHAAMRQAARLKADLTALPQGEGGADLVISSYALTEIPEGALCGVVDGLWERAKGGLILIEPGAPRDYARLMGARQRLIDLGARIALPCPHESACPLTPPEWCHFSARLPRSRDHKLMKDAEVPFEDEKYSYLVAFREGTRAFSSGEPRGARIIAPPRPSKWGVELSLCGPAGLERRSFAKRDKASFQIVRKAGWGDSIPVLSSEADAGSREENTI